MFHRIGVVDGRAVWHDGAGGLVHRCAGRLNPTLAAWLEDNLLRLMVVDGESLESQQLVI